MNLFCLILRSVSEKQPMLFQIYTDIHWIFHVLILFVFFQRILKYCFLVANDKLTFQDTYSLFIQSLLQKLLFSFRWYTKDILNKMEKDEDYATALLLNLKPWTQYAVYVQTYTTSSAKYGAISSIVYFTTLPYCKIYKLGIICFVFFKEILLNFYEEKAKFWLHVLNGLLL